MSSILTSISFSTPDLDKASGPKLYIIKYLKYRSYKESFALSVRVCFLSASVDLLSTSVEREVQQTLNESAFTDVQSKILDRTAILRFFLTVNTVKFIISLHPVPVRSLIYQQQNVAQCHLSPFSRVFNQNRGCLSPHTFKNLTRWNSVVPKFFQTERKTFMTFSH